MPGRAETREQAAARRAQEHAAAEAAAVAPTTGTPPEAEAPKAPVIDYVCGLRKTGPGQYAVVFGHLVDGKPELRIDNVSQTLDYAAQTLAMKLRAMIGEMP